MPLLFRALPPIAVDPDIAPIFSTLLAACLFCITAEFSASQDMPRRQSHTVFSSHGENLAFEGSVHDVPASLVHAEWGLGMIAGVLIGLSNNPGGSIGDALRAN
jgi:hypothetical protein